MFQSFDLCADKLFVNWVPGPSDLCAKVSFIISSCTDYRWTSCRCIYSLRHEINCSLGSIVQRFIYWFEVKKTLENAPFPLIFNLIFRAKYDIAHVQYCDPKDKYFLIEKYTTSDDDELWSICSWSLVGESCAGYTKGTFWPVVNMAYTVLKTLVSKIFPMEFWRD